MHICRGSGLEASFGFQNHFAGLHTRLCHLYVWQEIVDVIFYIIRTFLLLFLLNEPGASSLMVYFVQLHCWLTAG